MTLILISLALAGASIAWWTWLTDHLTVSQWLKSRTPLIGKFAHCGVCQMFWLSLLATILFDNFLIGLSFRFVVSPAVEALFLFLVEWFALVSVSIFFRYSILVSIESLKYFIKTLNSK